MEQRVKFLLQGRSIGAHEIELVQALITSNPSWNRSRLSKELCAIWNWRRASGEFKDIACRSFLRKLESRGYIQLPQSLKPNRYLSGKITIQPVLHSRAPIKGLLKNVRPIRVELVEKGHQIKLFKYLISAYHYLGWSGTVGENLKYLFFDCHGNPLGCMMFGAAAWKVQPRDTYIGWNGEYRMRNLPFVVNNNRFLILPWVEIPQLASFILGKICRGLNTDWEKKYCHPVYLAETFVEKERFLGTSYKAANWVHVGLTKGRGKLDMKRQNLLPIKDIWLYPLDRSFREKLCT